MAIKDPKKKKPMRMNRKIRIMGFSSFFPTRMKPAKRDAVAGPSVLTNDDNP